MLHWLNIILEKNKFDKKGKCYRVVSNYAWGTTECRDFEKVFI